MAYEGEVMNYCPADMFDWADTYAVIVTGAKLNPYGHMLLNTGGPGGEYFHVSELYGYPHMMNEPQFRRYLAENGKTIVSVMKMPISNPAAAQTALDGLLARKWAWGAIVHNCETFTQEVITAGGGPRFRQGMFPLPMEATNMCQSW